MTKTLQVATEHNIKNTKDNSKAYAIYMVHQAITDTYTREEVIGFKCYHLMMKFNALKYILNSICSDKEQYHITVLDDCQNSTKVWMAFNKMKHILDNFETELFKK